MAFPRVGLAQLVKTSYGVPGAANASSPEASYTTSPHSGGEVVSYTPKEKGPKKLFFTKLFFTTGG